MKHAYGKVHGVDLYNTFWQFQIRTFSPVGFDLVNIFDLWRNPVEGRTIVSGFDVFHSSLKSFCTLLGQVPVLSEGIHSVQHACSTCLFCIVFVLS